MTNCREFLVLSAFAALTGCSSSSSGKATTSDAGVDSGNPLVDSGIALCVPVGTPNNDAGVAGYCATGADCPLSFCIADVAPHVSPGFYCTTLCEPDAGPNVCGYGAVCEVNPEDPGQWGCTPTACK